MIIMYFGVTNNEKEKGHHYSPIREITLTDTGIQKLIEYWNLSEQDLELKYDSEQVHAFSGYNINYKGKDTYFIAKKQKYIGQLSELSKLFESETKEF